MIIFGTRHKFKTIDRGEFYCPHCRTKRPYERKEARPYFALYFIPVFPIGHGSEVIECMTCGTLFAPDALNAAPPQAPPDLAALINSIGRQLAGGTPVEFVVRALTGRGLDYDMARAIVERELGATRRTCPACNLTYAPGVETCTECGGALEGPR